MKLLLLMFIFIVTIITLAIQLGNSYQLDEIEDRIDRIYDATRVYCSSRNATDDWDG